MADTYTLPGLVAMPVPALTGRYLSHNQESRVVRAFFAADLHRGVKRLDKPTRLQAAFLARVNPTYVFWAEKRIAERAAIESGYVPLMPTAPAHTNGHDVVPLDAGIDDAQLAHIANLVGQDRMLAAACKVNH
jgi:hypothetical protein